MASTNVKLPIWEQHATKASSRIAFLRGTATRRALLVAAVVAIGLVWLLRLSDAAVSSLISKGQVEDVFNSTLGFQKVFSINLKERSDKKDLSVLAASYAGFQIEYMDGVKHEDIIDKAAPSNWDRDKQTPGALGCWRAHMNVLQYIVNNRIQSAMIVEDDADWSPFFKDQLFEMATGIRAIQQSPSDVVSPYGHSWDFLWLGHNRIGPTDAEQDIWVRENDFTVPPHKRRNSRWRQSHVLEEVSTHNDTRVYFKAYAGMCLYGYAVTYEGAQKMLSSISAQPRNQPVDQSVSDMCRGKMARGFDCYGVYPPLMATHRAAGYKSKDSDINSNDKTGWHEAYTFDIPFSTMMNIPVLADGQSTLLAQWPESDVQEVEFDPNVHAPASGYLKRIDFGALPLLKTN